MSNKNIDKKMPAIVSEMPADRKVLDTDEVLGTDKAQSATILGADNIDINAVVEQDASPADSKVGGKGCPSVGGQAVIEGVMMRAHGQLAIAVRKPSGDIILSKQKIAIDDNKWFKKPLLRGLIGLYDAMVLGIKALNFSAQQAEIEEDSGPLSKKEVIFSLVLGLGGGILLFVLLPLVLTSLLKGVIPAIERSFLVFNAVDGVIRVIFFVAYIFLIGLWSDIRRVFEYHGAEHKAIFAFESGDGLDIENARKMSRFHPRCGTSFLLIVMIVAIIVFSLIPKESHFVIKFGSRIVLLPIIAGLSYEVLKLSSKFASNPIVKALIYPGLLLQRLTTREPDDSQLEVAIASINAALGIEHKGAEIYINDEGFEVIRGKNNSSSVVDEADKEDEIDEIQVVNVASSSV